ncbi:Pycsar system effector family protein [Winogradskyella sp. A3E31]|uniref:Pycsar system effector family protein n=1 Tax=Winogradskyella sp. A3E31 TaxID=3349637 RepID=UPI00398AE11E
MEDKEKLKKIQDINTAARTPHAEELVDHYWGTMNYLSSLIKASELKAGLILSFYGIFLNFIYQSSSVVLNTTSHDMAFYVLIGLWSLATAISVFYCVRCFIPKIEGNYDPNIFFFGDVISKFGDIKSFSKTFYNISLDEEKLFEQLGEQIFIISKISAWKFQNVKVAIKFLAIGLLLLFISAVYFGITSML